MRVCKWCRCGNRAEAGSEFCRECLGLEDEWMFERLPGWAGEAPKEGERERRVEG